MRLRVDLRKTVEAGGNLDGRVCSDAAKGIAAAVRKEVTKGTCCQREKRSARSRRRRAGAHRGKGHAWGKDRDRG